MPHHTWAGSGPASERIVKGVAGRAWLAQASQSHGPFLAGNTSRGGDRADRLRLHTLDRRPRFWDRFRSDAHATEFTIDVSERIDPGNRFLSQVAALVERDGLLGTSRFLGQVFLGEVQTVQGKSCCDATGLEDLGAAGRDTAAQQGGPHIHESGTTDRQQVPGLPDQVGASHNRSLSRQIA